MTLCRFAKALGAPVLLGLAALSYGNDAAAGVACHYELNIMTVCEWTSPWSYDTGIKLTIGKDQNNVLRWVASRRDNPGDVRTNTMDSSASWRFTGSGSDDVMVEVPTGFGPIANGGYSLTAPDDIKNGVILYPGTGTNVVIGGDHTFEINANGGANLLVLFPNSYQDLTNAYWAIVNRVIRVSGGVNYLVAGAQIAASHYRWDNIALNAWSNSYNIDYLCNMNSTPIYLMYGTANSGDAKSGPAGTVTPGLVENSAVAETCTLAYVVAVLLAYQ